MPVMLTDLDVPYQQILDEVGNACQWHTPGLLYHNAGYYKMFGKVTLT